jgi:hypothetical protein
MSETPEAASLSESLFSAFREFELVSNFDIRISDFPPLTISKDRGRGHVGGVEGETVAGAAVERFQ